MLNNAKISSMMGFMSLKIIVIITTLYFSLIGLNFLRVSKIFFLSRDAQLNNIHCLKSNVFSLF